jgi:ATP-binding cassette, subfamily C, bacterial CydCD
MAIINAGLVIAQSYFIATIVVDVFQKHFSVSDVAANMRMVAFIYIGRSLVSYSIERLAASYSVEIRNELRTGLLDKVMSGKSPAVFNEGPGSISLLATKGIDNLDSYFSRFLPQLFIAAVVPLSVGLTIASQDKVSGLIVVFTVPLIPLFGIMIGRFTGAATEKRWQTMSLLSGYFLDLLTGLPTLKVFNRSSKQEEKLDEVGQRYRLETMKVLRISFLSSLALEIIATLSVALIAVSIGLRLVNGSLNLRTGLFILILSPEVYWPIRQVALYFHAAADGVEAANRIFAILEQPESDGSGAISGVVRISWNSLTVDFPGRKQIAIPAGEFLPGKVNIVVGPSGAGKSTFLSLLLGFGSNFQGKLLISTAAGDADIRSLSSESWRSLISWLPQDVNFPSGTVREILRHAAKIDDAELIAALARVGLAPADLPMGLDTALGTLTETLSVGQKRKIALARALLKPAEILILDEPSASVDDVSEADIAKAISSEVAAGKIVILVTHRLNLIDAPATVNFGSEE